MADKFDVTRRRLLQIAIYTPPAVVGTLLLRATGQGVADGCAPTAPGGCNPVTCHPNVDVCNPQTCNPQICNPAG